MSRNRVGSVWIYKYLKIPQDVYLIFTFFIAYKLYLIKNFSKWIKKYLGKKL